MPHQNRPTTAVRAALDHLRAGAGPDAIAAQIIRGRAEAAVLHARLPAGDPRQPHLEALAEALEARTFDDSVLSLESVLADMLDRDVAEAIGELTTPMLPALEWAQKHEKLSLSDKAVAKLADLAAEPPTLGPQLLAAAKRHC